jgi:hypothetical protein
VRIVSTTPFELELTPVSGAGITPALGQLYLHLLGQGFVTTPTADGARFLIAAIDQSDRRALDLLDALNQLPPDQLREFMDGSPALYLPPHDVAIGLEPPAGFAAGTLRLSVSAADAVPYAGGPGGRGNEGQRADVVVLISP